MTARYALQWIKDELLRIRAAFVTKTEVVWRNVVIDYADKSSIEVCICSYNYWLLLFMNKFRDGLALSLKIEAIFLVIYMLVDN